MGERNVDLSAYVPPDVRNTGALGGGQLQVELDDEDDHFGGGPPRAPQQSTPKPPPPIQQIHSTVTTAIKVEEYSYSAEHLSDDIDDTQRDITAEEDEPAENEPAEGVDSCRELHVTARETISNEDNVLLGDEEDEELPADETQREEEEKEVDTAVTYIDGEEGEVDVDMNALMAAELDNYPNMDHCASDCDTATVYSEGEEEQPRMYIVGETKPTSRSDKACVVHSNSSNQNTLSDKWIYKLDGTSMCVRTCQELSVNEIVNNNGGRYNLCHL
uniref:Uncharacterized protein n=1 Tax=Meloidogyne enterolobii TaxID=390850 RepID=A0A6V7XBG9_MELEN|nr:unnamed protein product [Meloidogyne enterolobii]